ncbi:MAG: universal stress protein [Beijerinckiaceae bacterium]|jgi:nucleotide-binding universal stress UspA family protein|nr:universal stress protein [Beijerinckiaceae bacterium]
MFKTIVVPIDLADVAVAKPALDAAIELARVSDGELRLVTVRSLMPVTYMEYVPADFDATAKAEAETELKALAGSLAMPKNKVSTVVRVGSVYGEVLEEAKASGADLIVVGSHRPSMATYLIGSNAGTIVRHATCSVLVVR